MRFTFLVTRSGIETRETIVADTIEDAWQTLDDDVDHEITSAHLDDVAP